jgi:hypothetical protein
MTNKHGLIASLEQNLSKHVGKQSAIALVNFPKHRNYVALPLTGLSMLHLHYFMAYRVLHHYYNSILQPGCSQLSATGTLMLNHFSC